MCLLLVQKSTLSLFDEKSNYESKIESKPWNYH